MLDFKILGIENSLIKARIGLNQYSYKSDLPGDNKSENLYERVIKIVDRSPGKSLAFLKRNSTLISKNGTKVPESKQLTLESVTSSIAEFAISALTSVNVANKPPSHMEKSYYDISGSPDYMDYRSSSSWSGMNDCVKFVGSYTFPNRLTTTEKYQIARDLWKDYNNKEGRVDDE